MELNNSVKPLILNMAGRNKLTNPEVSLTETFKSEVDLSLSEFPKDLGEKHPFQFKQCDILCNKFPIANTGIDKHLDFIMNRGFRITSDNKQADILIKTLIQETDFTLKIREWLREALKKGNGFIEINIEKDTINLKVVNANQMYLDRDEKGEIKGYKQYFGMEKLFDRNKVIPFKPHEIAHLKINDVAGEAYGFGLLYPLFQTIDNFVRGNKDRHMLLSRKANNPIICKVGNDLFPPTNEAIDTIGAKFEYLNNYHEWAVDYRLDFSVLDFGNIGDKFDSTLSEDLKYIFIGLQVPAVLMGDSQQNEGIANVQIDTFERRIQSIQEKVERVIEEQIFKPYLKLNGLDAHVEIEWEQLSEEAVNLRLDKLTAILSNMNLSPELRAMIELEIAKLLEFEEKDIDTLVRPKDAFDVEKEKEKELEQPEIPGQKQNTSEKIVNEFIESNIHQDITIEEFINLKEIKGFNYREYIKFILSQVEKDGFVDLKALNEAQIEEGLLSDSQIETLRKILYNGFKENKKLIEIENSIEKNIQFKDRLLEGKIILPADKRPSVVARTETVRLTNEGLVKLYKSNDIKEVSWLSSISDRTCPLCLSLDGRIFKINELSIGVNQPPLHPNCRCALLSVKE